MTITTMMGEKRDDDAIADDKARLVSMKNAFLATINHWVQWHMPSDPADGIVAAEQAFDDLIAAEWDDLCSQDGDYESLPTSIYLKQWKRESRQIGTVQTPTGACMEVSRSI